MLSRCCRPRSCTCCAPQEADYSADPTCGWYYDASGAPVRAAPTAPHCPQLGHTILRMEHCAPVRPGKRARTHSTSALTTAPPLCPLDRRRMRSQCSLTQPPGSALQLLLLSWHPVLSCACDRQPGLSRAVAQRAEPLKPRPLTKTVNP